MLNSARIMEITIITVDPCRHAKTGGGRLNTVFANHVCSETVLFFVLVTKVQVWHPMISQRKLTKNSGPSADASATDAVAVVWLCPEQTYSTPLVSRAWYNFVVF